ncbi:MAG: nitroreductase family protein [Chlamydiia bacterium]|nr:nitroreductase family protein [Chlamydiia bacterium]
MRHPDFPIQPLILNRWSPRAMSGEIIENEELMSLFEAARWAPSAYNAQPWRFIFAKRETKHWKPLFELLIEFNQSWAKDASALALIISHKVFEHNGKPSDTHSFDTGAAWENLALEGSARGLVIHGMQGFDYEKAKTICNIPDDFQVEAMIAIGKPGKKEKLSPEAQKKEAPSTRKPLSELVMEGKYQ